MKYHVNAISLLNRNDQQSSGPYDDKSIAMVAAFEKARKGYRVQIPKLNKQWVSYNPSTKKLEPC